MKKTLITLFASVFLFSPLHAQPPGTPPTYDETGSTWVPPTHIKALYLSFWGAGSPRITNRILNLNATTEINAVVIDIKNEYGHISFKGSVPEAKEIGAYNKATINDIREFVAELKRQGLYVIGRMVVFKDHLFATRHPNLAIKNAMGETWINNEKLAWGNPASTIAMGLTRSTSIISAFLLPKRSASAKRTPRPTGSRRSLHS